MKDSVHEFKGFQKGIWKIFKCGHIGLDFLNIHYQRKLSSTEYLYLATFKHPNLDNKHLYFIINIRFFLNVLIPPKNRDVKLCQKYYEQDYEVLLDLQYDPSYVHVIGIFKDNLPYEINKEVSNVNDIITDTNRGKGIRERQLQVVHTSFVLTEYYPKVKILYLDIKFNISINTSSKTIILCNRSYYENNTSLL